MKNLNFRVSGQNIITKTHSKYLGVILDERLSFYSHLNIIKYKLNRLNRTLAKLRHYVTSELLKAIYYLVFDSHTRYVCQVWDQS